MSEHAVDADGFAPLVGRAYQTRTPRLALLADGAKLNKSALRELGMPVGGWVAIGVKSSGLVRLRKVDEGHPEAAYVSVDGRFGRLHVWARDRGVREGQYDADVRDGALYAQLIREGGDA